VLESDVLIEESIFNAKYAGEETETEVEDSQKSMRGDEDGDAQDSVEEQEGEESSSSGVQDLQVDLE